MSSKTPKKFLDITVEYLNKKLPFGDIVELKEVTVGNIKGNASKTAFFELVYKNETEEKPKTIIVKLTGATVVYTMKFYHKAEVNTLRFLDKLKSPYIAKPYYTELGNKDLEFIIISEVIDGKNGGTLEIEAHKEVLGFLAKFQSNYWNLDSFKTCGIEPIFAHYSHFFLNRRRAADCEFNKQNVGFLAKRAVKDLKLLEKYFIKEEKEVLDNLLSLKFALEEKLVKALMNIFGGDNSHFETIIHGDFRADNFFFMENGDIKLIDFQMTSIGSPIFDLASYMFFQIEPKDFNPEELIKHYHSSLIDEIRKEFTVDVIRKLFEDMKLVILLPFSFWFKYSTNITFSKEMKMSVDRGRKNIFKSLKTLK